MKKEMDDSLVVDSAAAALAALHRKDPNLAKCLARLTEAVATEAMRSPRFATAIAGALVSDEELVNPSKRIGRRSPGVLNPFEVYADSGELGLRSQLGALKLDELRDIVAEHGMDHDRLAMKWKTPSRVIDRIVEKVSSRTAKGSAFRTSTESSHGRDADRGTGMSLRTHENSDLPPEGH
ncbi:MULTISPECIES: hypothetical protein [Gordonia]|uniref:hypothetical protein n=1 Tax=Gordonia TaxID=2053 RepID=UPI001BB1C648|nr:MULTISPECIES: hypothetical protein [Gordonia]UPG66344.1 hypothetical protein MVF96_12365 [Gordonia hongkongensis]